MIKSIAISIFVFILGLLTYHDFLTNTESHTIVATTTPDHICPTEDNFNAFWNEWSLQYINDNPYATVEMQMEDWNYLVTLYKCGDEWLDPLADLIREQGASSGTDVYWYRDSLNNQQFEEF